MQALLDGSEARVHLDGRHPEVRLPDRLRSQAHLCLDYAYGFTPPIVDLLLDEAGIHATLSFGGVPTATFIPWAAVYVIANFDGHGAVWQEDIPRELLAAGLFAPAPTSPTSERAPQTAPAAAPQPEPEAPSPAVKEQPAPPSPAATSTTTAAQQPRSQRPPWLREVPLDEQPPSEPPGSAELTAEPPSDPGTADDDEPPRPRLRLV
jgi:stringent starvation protein B